MYALISYIARSKLRIKILESLNEMKTPTKLAKELNMHRPSVSRIILGLEQKGLVKCLTPNEKLFRLYKITNRGKRILEEAKKFI